MNSRKVLIFVFFTIFTRSLSDKDELKIETIKKVDNCNYRSRLGDTLTWHFTGRLVDGTVFDTSVGKTPFQATLYTGKVKDGLDGHYGMMDMCVGEVRKLTVPARLGYGDEGYKEKNVPPKATVIFENELLKIVKSGAGEL